MEETFSSMLNNTYPLEVHHIKRHDTVDRLVAKSRKIFGGVYDYSRVTEEMVKNKCIVVFCTKCSNTWETDLNKHIWHKKGCPTCFHPISRITLPKLLILTEGKYSYELTETKRNYIALIHKIIITCNNCGHVWNNTLRNHLRNKSCPGCRY